MSETDLCGDAASSRPPRRRRRPEPSPALRAMGLLTRREHSARELERKLGARGVEPTEARATVDKLREAGWQNDARFAELLVRSRANSGYGPVFIRAELGMHGLAPDVILSSLSRFEEQEASCWIDRARTLVERRFADALTGDPISRRRAVECLLRRGFSIDQARLALSW